MEFLASLEGRAMCAAAVFGLVWLLKSVPWVSSQLGSDRARLLAAVVASLIPAALMMLDTSTSVADALTTGLAALLGAAGLQGAAKGAVGAALASRLGLSQPPKGRP
uniref:Holin n=1 Tax=viral metagenome TaxID=1070528 RepID=A0A6M3ILY9_9ZZZZ